MKRLVAFTVIASFAGSYVAFAGETLVQSASRIAQEAAKAQTVAAETVVAAQPIAASHASLWATRINPAGTVAEQGGGSVLSQSKLRKRTKAMIFIGLGAGFAASAWVIDHKVQDITPSSQGKRQD